MENGKTFGTLKGYVFHQSKLTFLYCKHQEKYVYIPIEKVVLGQDAIMLKTNYSETLLSASIKPEVYTLEGKKIGELSTIEFNECFEIAAINTGDQWIKKSDIVYMDHIVIVQSVDSKTEEALKLAEQDSPKISREVLQEDSELALINSDLSLPVEDENIKDASVIEGSEEATIDIVEEIPDTVSPVEEEVVVENEPILNDETHRDSDVDPRYSYLLGKRLLGSINVAEETFNRGVIIDSYLVQLALDNNAIVKVIMNSED